MSLIDHGIIQGSIISCDRIFSDKNISDAIQQGRAIVSRRSKPVLADQKLVILSQDCDIHNSQDKYIELVCINKIKPKDVNTSVQKNRNYRKVQIRIDGEYWSFEAELISVIEKTKFLEGGARVVGQLPARELEIVLDWRVGRYRRKALPNRFNQDLVINYIKKSGNEFGEYLEKNYEHINDLFVYITPRDVEEAKEYHVSITAVLYEQCTESKRKEITEQMKRHCQILHDADNSLKMFQIDANYQPTNELPPLDFALKMSDFTFLDASLMSRLNLDFFCYPDEDEI